jgi:hypothetical protein
MQFPAIHSLGGSRSRAISLQPGPAILRRPPAHIAILNGSWPGRSYGSPRDSRARSIRLIVMRDGASGLRLAELLAAFSLATDLGMGQPMDHVLRSWLIAWRPCKRAVARRVARITWRAIWLRKDR